MDSDPTRSSASAAGAINGSLWPVCLLAGTMVVLNGSAWLGWPLASVTPWLLGALALACLALLANSRSDLRGLLWALPALIFSWLAVSDAAGTLLTQRFVSAHPDAWSYDCVASYLLDHGRDQLAGMPLVDQFGSHLRNSRFSSSCLLALGKFVSGATDPFAIHTVFYLIILAVSYCSMAALAGLLGLARFWAQSTAAVSILAGWSTNALIIGNYDNLSFSALMPGALALLLQLIRSPFKWVRPALALGLVTAAILYTYPEGAALCGPTLLPLLVVALIQAKEAGRLSLLGRLLFAAALGVLLWLPYAPTFITFLASQVGMDADAVARPGTGNFPGLLADRFLPSIFALGTEYPAAIRNVGSILLAVVLGGLLLLGTWHMNRRHPWFSCSIGVTVLIVLWQALLQRYDYGVYKALYCHAWLVTPALLSGCHGLASRLPRSLAVTVLAGLAIAVAAERQHHRTSRVWTQDTPLAPISGLADVKHHSGDAPIFLNVDEPFAQMWALTVLRGLPVVVTERLGYLAMPHVQSTLDRARLIPANRSETLVLSEQLAGDTLWRNERFTLTRGAGALITRVDNPNGVEAVDGAPFVWIGHSHETVLHIRAITAGDYDLSANAWWGGPSLPDTKKWTIQIADAGGNRALPVVFPIPHLRLHLVAGENLVRLHMVEPPTLRVQPNGDQRELMLGMLGYFLKPASD